MNRARVGAEVVVEGGSEHEGAAVDGHGGALDVVSVGGHQLCHLTVCRADDVGRARVGSGPPAIVPYHIGRRDREDVAVERDAGAEIGFRRSVGRGEFKLRVGSL